MQELSKHYVDFGGQGPLIHFIHANGFDPGTYQKFFAPLLNDFRVVGLRLPPLTEDASGYRKLKKWDQFVDYVRDQVTRHNLKPDIAIGHSLGAVTSMLTANAWPEFCKQLILIDPVFLTPKKTRLLSWLPGTMVRRHPMIRKTLMRPDSWDSVQAAMDFHQPKRAFRGWDPDVLKDYITHSTHESVQGERVLSYPKEWEAAVYGTVRAFWKDIEQVSVPLTVIRGEQSDVLCGESWDMLKQRLTPSQLISVADMGHLLPMEQPVKVSTIIKEVIASANAN